MGQSDLVTDTKRTLEQQITEVKVTDGGVSNRPVSHPQHPTLVESERGLNVCRVKAGNEGGAWQRRKREGHHYDSHKHTPDTEVRSS